MLHNFKNLTVWQKARALAVEVYKHSADFPSEERFGLVAQMRKAAVSIPSNVAEGCGRDTDRALIYFLDVSIGSSCELETQVLLASDLGFLSPIQVCALQENIEEVRRMLIGFRKSLLAKSSKSNITES